MHVTDPVAGGAWRCGWLPVGQRPQRQDDLHPRPDRTARLVAARRRERREVVDLGIRYLSAHRLQPSAWMGHTSVPASQVIADWSGVYLLTTLAVHDPGSWQMSSHRPGGCGLRRSSARGIPVPRVMSRPAAACVDLVPPGEKQSIPTQRSAASMPSRRAAAACARQLYEHLCQHLSTDR